MLENDPRSSYRMSRRLRVLAFSVVASMVLVSLLIVIVRFLWDTFVVGTAFGEFLAGLPYIDDPQPYRSTPYIVVPAMLLIAAFLGKLLWDTAEETRSPQRK